MRPTTNGLNVSETERWRLAPDPARLQTFAGNPAARRTPGQPARRQRSDREPLKFRPLGLRASGERLVQQRLPLPNLPPQGLALVLNRDPSLTHPPPPLP